MAYKYLCEPGPRSSASCPGKTIWAWASHSVGRPSLSRRLRGRGDRTRPRLEPEKNISRAGIEKLLTLHPGLHRSHLWTHSRFWSRRSPGQWPRAGSFSPWSALWPDGSLRVLSEAWVRRPDPRRDGRSWSFCLPGRCRRSDCLWDKAWRRSKQLGGEVQAVHFMMLLLSAVGNAKIITDNYIYSY